MAEEVRAEMVANVKIVVAPGDSVEDGDTLVILESMKMEIPVIAESSGQVTALHVEGRRRPGRRCHRCYRLIVVPCSTQLALQPSGVTQRGGDGRWRSSGAAPVSALGDIRVIALGGTPPAAVAEMSHKPLSSPDLASLRQQCSSSEGDTRPVRRASPSMIAYTRSFWSWHRGHGRRVRR